MDAAYVDLGAGVFRATALTRGPWNPDHQHAGPPSALMARAIERAAASEGLTHLGRLTVNLLRPAPIGECKVEVAADYVGRSAGHYSGRLIAEGKESRDSPRSCSARTACPIPEGTPGHPPPAAPKQPGECPVVTMHFADRPFGYADLVGESARGGTFL